VINLVWCAPDLEIWVAWWLMLCCVCLELSHLPTISGAWQTVVVRTAVVLLVLYPRLLAVCRIVFCLLAAAVYLDASSVSAVWQQVTTYVV
jgi:hypothetical protein